MRQLGFRPAWVLGVAAMLALMMARALCDDQPKPPEKPPAGKEQAKEPAKEEKPEPAPVVTHHSITINGAELKYTATAGRLTLKDDDGKNQANIFFVAYAKEDGDAKARPVAFAFNGGPGSSSIWLHLGALGPQRVELADEGTSIPKSYNLVENAFTWLPFTDLVFVDPVGTGFSRAVEGVDAKKFYTPDGDVDSVGRFILLYAAKYDKWTAPKILVGESYGTTRAAGLLDYLQTKNGMNLNSVVLISSALAFQAILYESGNDLPYALALPSLTAAALYHHKLPDLASVDIEKTLTEVEHWAMRDYASALAEGDALPENERKTVADQLVKYTGLSKDFVMNNNLRISTFAFIKELLRNEHDTIGLLDARVKGVAVSPESEYARIDPALFVVTGPFVATFNAYVHNDLKYESEEKYEFLSMKVNEAWKWSSSSQGYLNVSNHLKEAITLNNRLRVFLAAGLYDLTCPYLSQRYMLTHLGLEPILRDHATFVRYPSGHQIYTSLPALEVLSKDVAAFVQDKGQK